MRNQSSWSSRSSLAEQRSVSFHPGSFVESVSESVADSVADFFADSVDGSVDESIDGSTAAPPAPQPPPSRNLAQSDRRSLVDIFSPLGEDDAEEGAKMNPKGHVARSNPPDRSNPPPPRSRQRISSHPSVTDIFGVHGDESDEALRAPPFSQRSSDSAASAGTAAPVGRRAGEPAHAHAHAHAQGSDRRTSPSTSDGSGREGGTSALQHSGGSASSQRIAGGPHLT